MFIDYAILGVISLATLVYAYLNRPDGGPHTGGDDGGSRRPRTSPPVDTPDPAHTRPDRSPVRDRPSQQIPETVSAS